MNGLDLCRNYFETYGFPMLKNEFSAVSDRVAAGLVGEGSECLGFDDEISRDHDFGPAFCLFLTEKDYAKFGFSLERAYAKLPRAYMGARRPLLSSGNNRHGVFVIDDFYARFLGTPRAPVSPEQWLALPSSALLAASSGEVFTDPLGEFSAVREVLKKGYPEDVRRKKLAGVLLLASQAGSYNFQRSVKRHDKEAAQLALFEFVRHALSAAFLIFNRYEPFYKWAFRAFRDLPAPQTLKDALSALLLGAAPSGLAEKQRYIDAASSCLADLLRSEGLSKKEGAFLDAHAIFINDTVKDATLRNMNILAGV